MRPAEKCKKVASNFRKSSHTPTPVEVLVCELSILCLEDPHAGASRWYFLVGIFGRERAQSEVPVMELPFPGRSVGVA